MRNDSYLPGALLQAYALRKQQTAADITCLVTPEISAGALSALELVFDHIIEVEPIFVPHARRHKRQDRPFLLTRLHALRLGRDGDLGLAYRKIVLLDADILPIKHYDHLFCVDAPAGILNERREHFYQLDSDGRRILPQGVNIHARWTWHATYSGMGHGMVIPSEVTDRVEDDPGNLGVNTALMVLEPSVIEYQNLMEAIEQPHYQRLLAEVFDWPDMQFLTLYWSGRWKNIDICFCGLNGYPSLEVLFGTHFAGVKPWNMRQKKSVTHYSRFHDYRLWYAEYREMMEKHPALNAIGRLSRILAFAVQA